MDAMRVKREEDRIKRLEDAEVSLVSVVSIASIFSYDWLKINMLRLLRFDNGYVSRLNRVANFAFVYVLDWAKTPRRRGARLPRRAAQTAD